MTQGRIVIITGTPATGKSTLASLLANQSDKEKSVHMHTDDFYHFIKKGRIAPHLKKAHLQNKIVIDAFLEATKVFAQNGYDVIVDGIVGPWFLDPWFQAAKDGFDVHYIILRASKEETLTRGRNRNKLDEATNLELIQTMWDQFNQLGEFEAHVLDTTTQTIEQSLDQVRQCIQDHSMRLNPS
ncbi:AAA family ATPase [Candidatus Enterococcus murrayae]|uniref:AAA family ATPase n=1 Tax=Candidatus Enterococcus murrayae TaxID=2815321 RepID=A0ABS3HHE2_9ENTE|nr:AAA family ATPase [Enterococcus sp. MJM16]MBO0452872.1 AAA family ATPase [Enterococcus sp. MJM16]